MNCAVVIPCLNEARHIDAVVRGAREYLPNVSVVDDGSEDRTGEIAEKAGAKILRNAIPQGKGAALHAGFRAAAEEGFQWALAMDGDGQHDPGDIPRFFNAPAKMVIGDRMSSNHARPWVRRFVNQWMTAQINHLCALSLPDSQCGFRLVHLESWLGLSFEATHFEVESELIVRFAAARYSIASVPVRTVYANERSKIRPLRDTVRWFAWWLSIRRESLRSVGLRPAAAPVRKELSPRRAAVLRRDLLRVADPRSVQ